MSRNKLDHRFISFVNLKSYRTTERMKGSCCTLKNNYFASHKQNRKKNSPCKTKFIQLIAFNGREMTCKSKQLKG